MSLEILTLLLLIISVTSVMIACFVVHRTRSQIREITEALQDIKNGNGNRRILSNMHAPAAGVIFSINEIVQDYERKIAAFQKTEEMNRQLMTSLSHDVRTPLTTLLGYLDAVHKGIVLEKGAEEYVERARVKAHDLKDYIEILFDWMKLNSDEYSLDLKTQDITALTRSILKDWIPILEEKHLEYDIEIPEERLLVCIDEKGYSRIVGNLIQNVITHSNASKIEILLLKKVEDVVFSVKDNGVGIEREDLKHIFDRLYKGDKARSGKDSGLGLSITKQLTEKMNGKIGVESQPGNGTVFTLSFPLGN